MAKGEKRAAVKESGGGGAGGGQKLLLFVGLVISLPILAPTVILLFFALLPTLVAGLVDRGPNRLSWVCVGGLNFAGVSPYLFALWAGGHTIDLALEQLSDVIALLVIFASAGVGWLIYAAMPPVMSSLMQITAQRRVVALRTAQRKLVEQWGPDVATHARQ